MKTLSIEELQVLFGGEEESQNKCDELQKEYNKHVPFENDKEEEEWYEDWIDRFLECANGHA